MSLDLCQYIGCMAIYQYRIALTKPKYDAAGNEVVKQTPEMKFEGTVITTIYSVVVVILGNIYKTLAVVQTEAENWRYQKQYTDILVNRLFQFSIFNFYFPMIYVAFDANNTRNYVDLFNMMLV